MTNANHAIGEHIRTSDGKSLGRVTRFVVDPASRQLTALVIDHGPPSTEQVVDMVYVNQPADGEVVLAVAKDGVGLLPPYVRDEIARASESPETVMFESLASVVMDPSEALLSELVIVETVSSIPDSRVVLSKHTKIVSADGFTIGHLHALSTDEQNCILGVVTTSGLIYRQHLRLAASLVVEIRHDRIGLTQRLDEVTDSLEEANFQPA